MMRSIRTESWLAMVALLTLAASLAPAQPSPTGGGSTPGSAQGPTGGGSAPAKPRSQLEEWLDQAVKTHPDIKVAEAKMRTALAELEQARSLVMQKVLAQYYAIQSQKVAVEKAELELARLQPLEKSGSVPVGTVEAARANIVTAKAKLTELQAQAEQLIGKAPTAFKNLWRSSVLQDDLYLLDKDRERDTAWLLRQLASYGLQGAKPAAGPMADQLRKALDTRVTLTVSNESVESILKKLQQQIPDLIIKIPPSFSDSARFSLTVKDLPLGAALQWIEDGFAGYRFYVREYGLLLAPTRDMLGSGTLRMIDFWKGVAKDSPKTSSEK
jgi:hypothetical protein